MNKSTALALIAGFALLVLAVNDRATGQSGIDEERVRWIQEVIHRASDIKPGMLRSSLSTSFAEDGGLQSRSQGRYVYRGCPYIKIRVEFSPVSEGPEASPEDRILKISPPYLEYPVSD